MRIFDAGCGYGRNLTYLLQAGYEVFACDGDPEAIASLQQRAALLAPHLPLENFRAEPLEALTLPPTSQMSSSATPSCTSPGTSPV